MQRYSRQREMIYDYLKNTTSHPTAEVIYNDLKEDCPSLSLATVYRNLNLLADTGRAVRLDTGENVVRFDANTDNHYHFVCTSCHRVLDIFDEVIKKDTIKSVLPNGATMDGHKLFIYGKCDRCASLL